MRHLADLLALLAFLVMLWALLVLWECGQDVVAIGLAAVLVWVAGELWGRRE